MQLHWRTVLQWIYSISEIRTAQMSREERVQDGMWPGSPLVEKMENRNVASGPGRKYWRGWIFHPTDRWLMTTFPVQITLSANKFYEQKKPLSRSSPFCFLTLEPPLDWISHRSSSAAPTGRFRISWFPFHQLPGVLETQSVLSNVLRSSNTVWAHDVDSSPTDGFM